MPMRIVTNPCLKCGACCATFRVSFYWSEANPANDGSVPLEMTEPLPPYLSCMRGTNQPHPRCAALCGQVGDQVSCSIYTLRSSTCHEFGFHSENGHLSICPEDLERCNQAREVWGLSPLQFPPTWLGSTNHRHRPPLR